MREAHAKKITMGVKHDESLVFNEFKKHTHIYKGMRYFAFINDKGHPICYPGINYKNAHEKATKRLKMDLMPQVDKKGHPISYTAEEFSHILTNEYISKR